MSGGREAVAAPPAKAAPARATTTLRVGPADDAFEREADRAADAVARGGLAPWINALPGGGGLRRTCDACAKEDEATLRRDAAGGDAGGWSAPPIVGEVLRSAGRPLDAPVRAEMERGFGHDFSRVRVHDDTMAAESARAVSAHAYTVGENVVFGAGQYAPTSPSGRRLLAHELTHVAQQRGPGGDRVVRRDSYGDEPTPRLRLLDEGLRIDPRFTQPPLLLKPGSLRETFVLPNPTLPPLVAPDRLAPRASPLSRLLPPPRLSLQFTPVTLIRVSRCVPDRPLTWGDFAEQAGGGRSAARTSMHAPEELNVQGNPMFRVALNGGASWVRPKYKRPAERSVNGCAAHVRTCEAHFRRAGAAGGTWSLGAGTGCAASAQPDPSQQATSSAECASVVGAECDRVAALESARLLQHEQGHFGLSCTLVNSANDALANGAPLATVRTRLRAHLAGIDARYDADTQHGCLAGPQATWEQAIASGLPAYPIP